MECIYQNVKFAFSRQGTDESAGVDSLLERTADVGSKRTSFIWLCFEEVIHDGQPILGAANENTPYQHSAQLGKNEDERTAHHFATFRTRL